MTDDTITVQPDEQAVGFCLLHEPRDEAERVRAWHIEQFARLGFDDETAEQLADSRVDWHEAARLIDAGCPVGLAGRILL